MTPTSIRRFVWGITVLSAGVVLVLQSLDIISGLSWRYIWPVFVIIIGLELMLTAVFDPDEETELKLLKYWSKKPRRGKK
jgi:hypothetical protein